MKPGGGVLVLPGSPGLDPWAHLCDECRVLEPRVGGLVGVLAGLRLHGPSPWAHLRELVFFSGKGG